MKDEPVHELEHATPTVIQHHDEDMTVLARWLQRGMEQGPKFWILVVAAAVVITGLVVLGSGVKSGASAASEGWVELIPAKTADDKVKIADEHPTSSAAHWARLQAAMEEYDSGFLALVDPKQRDLTAGPKLRSALGYFKKVAEDAPADSRLRPVAALGVARTLEALNQLPEAIRQYKLVAETYKDTPEAKQAEALAKVLEDPESAAFYKELYTATPPSFPGSEISRPSIPGFISPNSGKSFLPNLPGPADMPAPPTSGGAPVPPPPIETPKAEAPKAETPAAKPAVPFLDIPKVENPAKSAEPPAKPAEAPKPAADPSTAPPK